MRQARLKAPEQHDVAYWQRCPSFHLQSGEQLARGGDVRLVVRSERFKSVLVEGGEALAVMTVWVRGEWQGAASRV
jgi:hypothetical protein